MVRPPGLKSRSGKSAPFQKTLVIMVKAPRAGAVKTRLADEIGVIKATFFYRHMCRNLIMRLANDRRWRTLLASTPDTDLKAPFWAATLPRRKQGWGTLGSRMQVIFDNLPPGPVVIIGTDIPEITNRYIAEAFRNIGSSDAVIGPSEDGGYWLIGLKRTPRVYDIFHDVRWSTEFTFEDTLANLSQFRVAILDKLTDVDHGRDYWILKNMASRVVSP